MSAKAKAAAENAAYRAAHPDTNWEEINKHTGTAWKQDPGYQARREFFPAPLSLSSSGVPVTRLNARSGVTSTTVRPNALNNAPFETRYRTFENNFMNRIKVTIDNAFNSRVLELNKYTNRLQEASCSREEAILIYDELIAILIVLILVIAYTTTEYMRLLKANPKMPALEIISKINIKSFIDKLFIFGDGSGTAKGQWPGLVTAFGTLAVIIAGLYNPVSMAAIITTPLGIIYLAWPLLFVVIGVPMIPILATTATHQEITRNISSEKRSLFGLIQNLLNVMFDNRNTHTVQSVRGDLKYWGLTKAQVDYLFTVNPEPEDPPEIPPLTSATGVAHNMNEAQLKSEVSIHKKAIESRDKDIEESRQTHALRQERGYKLFGAKQILEFLRLSSVNPNALAPNARFPEAVVRLFPGAVTVAEERALVAEADGPPVARQGGKRSHKKKTHKKRTQKKRK